MKKKKEPQIRTVYVCPKGHEDTTRLNAFGYSYWCMKCFIEFIEKNISKVREITQVWDGKDWKDLEGKGNEDTKF